MVMNQFPRDFHVPYLIGTVEGDVIKIYLYRAQYCDEDQCDPVTGYLLRAHWRDGLLYGGLHCDVAV